MSGTGNPYRIYWTTWVILLLITAAMLVAEALRMPPWFLAVFLLAFMMVKACMIAGNFMHMRYEKASLAVIVGVGILATSVVLYALIAEDSHRIFDLAGR